MPSAGSILQDRYLFRFDAWLRLRLPRSSARLSQAIMPSAGSIPQDRYFFRLSDNWRAARCSMLLWPYWAARCSMLLGAVSSIALRAYTWIARSNVMLVSWVDFPQWTYRRLESARDQRTLRRRQSARSPRKLGLPVPSSPRWRRANRPRSGSWGRFWSMWDCARLTTRPTRLDFRAAPHGPFSKRVTKAMGSQQRSLNACCGPLSSRHAPARSWWNTSRKSPSVSMVGAGNNNSDLPFACPTPSQAGRAPMKRNGEGAKKCPGGARSFRGQCVRARWRMRAGRARSAPPRSGDWGKADLIGQPLAVSHENLGIRPG